jgi:EpsI family protein
MACRMIILSFLFLSGWLFNAQATKSENVPIHRSLTEFPLQIDDWIGMAQPPLSEAILANLGVDDYLGRTYYRRDSRILDFYVGYYQSQRQGKSIHSPMNCLPGAGWNAMKRGTLDIPVQTEAGSKVIGVNRVVIAKGLDKQVVIYWYQSHSRVIASEYWGRIYAVLDAVRTRRTDAALVRVIIPVNSLDSGESAAEQAAVEFVRSVFPRLDQYLPN